MNALFKIIILFSTICFISAKAPASSPLTDNAINILTVFYNKIDSAEVKPNFNNKNYGDLVVGEKQDKDILLYREVFINNNETHNQYFLMKTSSDKYKFRNIRFLNIGRQIGYQYDYSLVDKSKLEIKFTVNKTEQARIWIEIYGNNGSTILASGLLLIITNIIYQLIK